MRCKTCVWQTVVYSIIVLAIRHMSCDSFIWFLVFISCARNFFAILFRTVAFVGEFGSREAFQSMDSFTFGVIDNNLMSRRLPWHQIIVNNFCIENSTHQLKHCSPAESLQSPRESAVNNSLIVIVFLSRLDLVWLYSHNISEYLSVVACLTYGSLDLCLI